MPITTRTIPTPDGPLTLTFEELAGGGYLVTSPHDPELLTQAETLDEGVANARDAIAMLNAHRAASTPPLVPS